MTTFMRDAFSSVGQKYAMALTGLALYGFAVGHTAGNLNAYLGQDAMNAYAAGLKSMGPLLWIARIGLLVVFIVHVVTAIRLNMANRAARPVPYAQKKSINATFASRTMIISGVVLLLFIGYHLLHFTFHQVGGDIFGRVDSLGRPDVQYMFVMGFKNPAASLLYIVGNVLLGFHITHGFQSLFQSLGFNHSRYTPCIKSIATALGWGLAAINISFPVSVMLGVITV